MVQIFSNAQFGFDVEFHSALEKLLIETLGSTTASSLRIDFTTDGSRDFDPPDERDFLAGDQGFSAKLTESAYDVIGKSGYVGATVSRIARRSKCSPALVYKLHRSKEDLVVGAFRQFVVGRQLNTTSMDKVLDEGFFASVLQAEVGDGSERRRNFSLETILAAGHSDTMRQLVLGELIHGASARAVLVEADDEQNERLNYAARTVTSVVLAVSWLATITRSTEILDMNSFAEPLRCGLLNQWFPGSG